MWIAYLFWDKKTREIYFYHGDTTENRNWSWVQCGVRSPKSEEEWLGTPRNMGSLCIQGLAKGVTRFQIYCTDQMKWNIIYSDIWTRDLRMMFVSAAVRYPPLVRANFAQSDRFQGQRALTIDLWLIEQLSHHMPRRAWPANSMSWERL
jgi:hypothetical protein